MSNAHKEFPRGQIDTSTPVLLLGGRENALSIARRFGRIGITVRASGASDRWALYSKYCAEPFPVPRDVNYQDYWAQLLLSGNHPHLGGHLLIACNDQAIEFIASNYRELKQSYVLMEASPKLQHSFLNKKQTLELAREAGLSAPQFWPVSKLADLHKIRHELQFPIIIKPTLSHQFQSVFGCKLFIIESDFDELVQKVTQAWDQGLEVMITEMIPGPDSALTSYYTYAGKTGEFLFDYTKCVIRRYPMTHGGGCYHKSKWLPETAQMGRKFFKDAGLKGFGNIEFKRDPRDGLLKIIECNCRFTAAQELAVRSGVPIDFIVYCDATNQEIPAYSIRKSQLTLWYPIQDFMSFLELNRKGMLGPVEWIKSLLPFGHVLPLNDFTDPLPTLRVLYAKVLKSIGYTG